MNRYILATLLFLFSCVPHPSVDYPLDISFSGKSLSFINMKAYSLREIKTVETSLMTANGLILLTHDKWPSSMVSASLGRYGISYQYISESLNVWHSNSFYHKGIFYTFAKPADGFVYLWRSSDMIRWHLMNQGQPVLTNKKYNHVWNVHGDIDDEGGWHILAETAHTSDQFTGVGLSYSTSTLANGMIEFDTNLTDHVVPFGGNPHVEWVSGRGLLSIHGKLESGFWHITASTYDGIIWQTHPEFNIVTSQIHLADPSVTVAPGGGLLMSISYDQRGIVMTRSHLSFTELYDYLRR